MHKSLKILLPLQVYQQAPKRLLLVDLRPTGDASCYKSEVVKPSVDLEVKLEVVPLDYPAQRM